MHIIIIIIILYTYTRTRTCTHIYIHTYVYVCVYVYAHFSLYNIYLIYIYLIYIYFLNIKLIISSFLSRLKRIFALVLFILFTNASIRHPIEKKKKNDRKRKKGRNAIIARVSCRIHRCHLYARRHAEDLPSHLTAITFSLRRFLGTSRDTHIRSRVTRQYVIAGGKKNKTYIAPMPAAFGCPFASAWELKRPSRQDTR